VKKKFKSFFPADYYIWKPSKGNDSSGNPIPPNEWVSQKSTFN
jgi:hypothetical protein